MPKPHIHAELIKAWADGATYTVKGLIQVEDAIHYTNQLRKQS